MEDRWICCAFKESLGMKGDSFTLIDNFCERYYIVHNKITGELTVDKGRVYQNSIYLTPKINVMSRLPDFAIDVLQTISVPIGIETLSRVAETFKRKYYENK